MKTIRTYREAIKSHGFSSKSRRITGETWEVIVVGHVGSKSYSKIFEGDREECFRQALAFVRYTVTVQP